MSKQQVGFDINAEAGHDLSSHQYYFVKLIAADTVSAVNGQTDMILGVLQNDPESGNSAAVRILGHSKVYSGSDSLAYGDVVGATPEGTATAVAADSSTGTVGLCMSAASSGSVSEVVLFGVSAAN